MKELEHKRVTLWLSPKEIEAVKKAARDAGQRTATYCRGLVLKQVGFRQPDWLD